MEQKHSSSEQGRQRRPSNRRRRRRRRHSPVARPAPSARPAPAPAANRTPAARDDAARDNAASATGEPRGPVPAQDTGEPRAPVPAPATGPRTCPLCAQPVDDLYTAIAYGDRGAPAHFDCIVALLGEREELEEGARLCYLGGGSFGIVQMRASARSGDRGGTLLIHKRIEVEERDSAPAWREELRLPMPERRVNVAASEVATSEEVPCK